MRKKVKRKFVIASNISDHCGDQVCNANWFKFMCEMRNLCGLLVKCSQRAIDNVAIAHDCQNVLRLSCTKNRSRVKKLINEILRFIWSVNKTFIYEEKKYDCQTVETKFQRLAKMKKCQKDKTKRMEWKNQCILISLPLQGTSNSKPSRKAQDDISKAFWCSWWWKNLEKPRSDGKQTCLMDFPHLIVVVFCMEDETHPKATRIQDFPLN